MRDLSPLWCRRRARIGSSVRRSFYSYRMSPGARASRFSVAIAVVIAFLSPVAAGGSAEASSPRVAQQCQSPPDGLAARPFLPPTCHVVVRGEWLWKIARARLNSFNAGPRPARSEIAGLVRVIYDVNRDVIGPNPNALRIGDVLFLPQTGAPGPNCAPDPNDHVIACG
jgi:nucleoid-associated protein YgaU